VEDDAWVRGFLRDILTDEGYAVSEAADGHTGLRLALEQSPNLILLDVAMPEFTGVDVLRTLKRDPHTRDVPGLILSAFAWVVPARDARTAAAVLAKPVDVPTLLTAVEDALRP
jgi:CheY-like chemotaxis protein